MQNAVAKKGNQQDTDNASQHIISHSTSYRVKSRAEISGLLGKLFNNHTLLSITLEDSKKVFGSMILEVSHDESYLVLDELYPRNELKVSLVERKLFIETQVDGIEVRFTVKVNAIATRDGIEYYKAPYPAYIFHHQRRASFRVGIGVTEAMPMAMSTEDDVLLHAELRDISLGGISARINSPTAGGLAVGDEIPTCIIHTPDGKKIVSALEIARIDEATATQSVRIGARFTQLSAADRHELSRLIAKLDRENIKKLKRLTDS